jgi:signal transduction histidine kinase
MSRDDQAPTDILSGHKDEAAQLKKTQEQLRTILELSELLASSLDYEQSFQKLAEFLVPRLADGCVIDIVERNGVVRRPIAVIAAPEKRVWGERLRHLRPPEPSATSGFYSVVRAGLMLAPELTEHDVRRGARDAEHASILMALAPTSGIGVTLKARGDVLGILWVYMAESGRAYAEADVAVFEDLARRSALLLDNARLYQDAARAIAERDEFLSIAAHEFRTPLTTLQLSLQSLSKLARTPGQSFDAATLSRLDMIERQGLRLRQIVEDLLDVSRLEATELRTERIDLSRLVRELAASLEAQAERFGCRLELDIEPEIVGHWDAMRVERVVQNLMANAFKFGRGHPVGVSLVRRGERAVLRVVDHGIGIDADDQARVFERFVRAVSVRHYGGLGLGLWIAQKAIESMGGTISVASVAGEGAAFTVELPLVQ